MSTTYRLTEWRHEVPKRKLTFGRKLYQTFSNFNFYFAAKFVSVNSTECYSKHKTVTWSSYITFIDWTLRPEAGCRKQQKQKHEPNARNFSYETDMQFAMKSNQRDVFLFLCLLFVTTNNLCMLFGLHSIQIFSCVLGLTVLMRLTFSTIIFLSHVM